MMQTEQFKEYYQKKISQMSSEQAEKLLQRNLLLIGFMGCGKSTVSSFWGKALDWEIIEMDEMIVEQEGMSINEIFAAHGEPYFRNKETNLLKAISEKSHQVVSCGGGVPLREENVEHMRKNGVVIWLTAQPETILERVSRNDNRPLLRGNKNIEFITDMMSKRYDKYKAAADIRVAVDQKEPGEICQEILDRLLNLK